MKKNASSNKTAHLHIRMTPERLSQILAIADSLETTPSMLVRTWVNEKLSNLSINNPATQKSRGNRNE